MANQFNQILPNQPYISQSNYVPLPFQELAYAGEAKQKSYQTTKDAIEKSLLESKIASIPYHDEARNKFVQGFEKEARDLVGNPDPSYLGSPEGKAKAAALIYKYKTNPDLQTFQRSVDNFKKQQEDITELKKKPGEYGYWNDP